MPLQTLSVIKCHPRESESGFMYILRASGRPPLPSFELPKKAIPAGDLELVPWTQSGRIN
jgi:hypothetical protein